MTDTDFLLYNIHTDDVYKDIQTRLDFFDTSEYPPTHTCYSPINKKKLGTFKDKINNVPTLEFVGLRAKCYSFITDDLIEKTVVKSVPRSGIKRQLKLEQYRDCVKSKLQKLTTSNIITRNMHNIYTNRMVKQSVSPYDDKRYILEGGESTLTSGHYKITNGVLQQVRASVIIPPLINKYDNLIETQ